MAIFEANDLSFINTTLAQVGSWTEQTGTIFSFTSVGTSGTTSEAGDPQSVTYGTRSASLRMDNVDMTTIEKSSGRYQQNDKRISVRGSFTKDDMLVVDGTYRPVDGPWKYYMGSNLFWQGICRKVQS